MAMREARLEVDGEPVAEGEAGVLRVRACVGRAREAQRDGACYETAVEPRETAGSGGPTTRRLGHARPTRDGVKPPFSRAMLGWMG